MRSRALRLNRHASVVPPFDRDTRHPVNLIAWVAGASGAGPVHITDVSQLGFGARCWMVIPIGSEISITLPRIGRLRAQIRWALGGLFGARFLPELDDGQLRECIGSDLAGAARPGID